MAFSPSPRTYHVRHPSLSLEVSLAFQPVQVVGLLSVLESQQIFEETLIDNVNGKKKKKKKKRGADSHLLLLCFDPPGQQLGAPLLVTALTLGLTVLNELPEAVTEDVTSISGLSMTSGR